jgi:hypothetical protein
MKKTTNHKTIGPVFEVHENVSLEEQIAQRAHELWQQRGGEHGSDQTGLVSRLAGDQRV